MSLDAIDRLISVIEAENIAMEEGRDDALAEFAARKARCLMELSGVAPNAIDDDALKARSRHLRALLARNAILLKARIDVSESLSETLARSLKAEQSDGTYRRFGRDR